MTIKLVKNGIFPITKDKNGNILENIPDTGYNISGTIQGEGLLSGVPSLFIRTSGCTLRCAWEMANGEISLCDTPYSSHNATEFDIWEVNDIVATIKQNLGNVKHVVITGGEPTMQAEAVAELAKELKMQCDVHITLETNGTFFSDDIARWVDLYSVSPKLKDSIPYISKMQKLGRIIDNDISTKQIARRRNISVLQSYINMKYIPTEILHTIQLKFVISKPENIDEIKTEFIDKLDGIYNNEIFLMPVGRNKQQLLESSNMVLKLAIENGYRFCPRLHIDLFGEKAGV